MGKLEATNPEEVMVIRSINPYVTTLSVPFWRFGLIKVGGRGTLVKLQSGNVAVFSPVALTPTVKDTITKMGEVKYIAALDIEHHIHLGEWHAAFPNAKVIAMEGLKEKREKQKNEMVPFGAIFTEANRLAPTVDAEFDADFEVEYMPGHMNKELIFCHKPSKTLITADLIFNLPATEQFSKAGGATDGILTKLFTAVNGTSGAALGQKRFQWYGLSRGSRDQWAESTSRISKWDFDTIVPCHGDVIETGGKSIFEKVFEWHLAAAKKTT